MYNPLKNSDFAGYILGMQFWIINIWIAYYLSVEKRVSLGSAQLHIFHIFLNKTAGFIVLELLIDIFSIIREYILHLHHIFFSVHLDTEEVP